MNASAIGHVIACARARNYNEFYPIHHVAPAMPGNDLREGVGPYEEIQHVPYGRRGADLFNGADRIAPFLAFFEPRRLQPRDAFTGKLHHSITMLEGRDGAGFVRWICRRNYKHSVNFERVAGRFRDG